MSAAEAIENALGESGLDDMADPADILDALKDAGFIVVELPKPMVDREGVAEVLRSLPMWLSGDAWTCLREPDLMEFEADAQNVYGELSIAAARNLAVALLAAADAAEVTQ